MPDQNSDSVDSDRFDPRVVPIHTILRGRARFNVAGLYRSSAMKRRLEEQLSLENWVHFVSANPLTGNVLIRFDPERELESVVDLLREAAARNHPGSSPRRNGVLVNGPGQQRALEQSEAPRLARIRQPAQPSRVKPWHLMEAEHALAATGTSRNAGLSTRVARGRLESDGANLLPHAPPRSRLAIALEQIASTPVLLLVAAAGVSVLTGGLADAAVILGVVAINATIGFVTESQSERSIESLRSRIDPAATVIRDGTVREISGAEVVVGDLLLLKRGTQVPADCRLLDVEALSVDESLLTGESAPVDKVSGTLVGRELALADRVNMAYMGTIVTGGQGLAVVIATGVATEIGRIQALAAEAETPETPMQRQLTVLGHQLAVLVGGVCALVFGMGVLQGYGLPAMLKTSIALAVAAIPEGLPAIATTILALGVLRMRERHVLIRQLSAVETLGCVQAVCLDKTGTLTLNRMSAVAVHLPDRLLNISDGEFRESGSRIDPASSRRLSKLLEVGALCSESEVNRAEDGYAVTGSPTENALVYLALAGGRDVVGIREGNPVLQVAPRAEDRNFMSTLHLRRNSDGQRGFMVAVKGSPGEVIARCNWQLVNGEVVPLSGDDRSRITEQNEAMAGLALRVLAFAFRDHEVHPPSNGDDDLVWLGLVGMADPVRPGVRDAIRGFHRAGVDTIMLTGDQSGTARAIGEQLRLSRNGPIEILDADKVVLNGADVHDVNVFARISPANKLEIVRALQKAGKVVAMTGDGVNDSPALKAADIGIAMGAAGTDVAREVADVILENDDLQTMLVAVEQGRTIYSNIRKAVHFLLATNFSEVIMVVASMASGLGQPLNAMQLLWINLVSETSVGLALALEPPEPDIMEQPPRDRAEAIIPPRELSRMGGEALTLSGGALAAYGYGVARYGQGAQAGTLGFTTLTAAQLLHAIVSRSENHSIYNRGNQPRNWILDVVLVGSLALQGLTLVISPLRSLLGTVGVGLADLGVIAAGSTVPLLINEAIKAASSPRP